MIDWSQVRFQSCRLCGEPLYTPGPRVTTLDDYGIRPGMTQLFSLCERCLWRASRWLRGKAGWRPYYGKWPYDPADGITVEEYEEQGREELAALEGHTLVGLDSGWSQEVEIWARFPNYWRDEKTAINDLDIAEYVADVMQRRPKWANLHALAIAA